MNHPELLEPTADTYQRRLTYDELTKVEEILSNEEKFHHIKHTLENLVRIPYQFIAYNNLTMTKIAQFGLNLGRSQELLDSIGGVDYWWRVFKPPIDAADWKALLAIAKDRFIEIMGSLELLDLEELDRL